MASDFPTWLASMRALVAQATPGPWEYDECGLVTNAHNEVADTYHKGDDAYIAAVHPTILARLLDVVEAAGRLSTPLHEVCECEDCQAVLAYDRAIRALVEGNDGD